ncbi:LytR/AlgR family response regulator transcription factor [Fibrivirga algicola]|uniref:Response regulator transcription factor n=1 Tax=Fibrivirga algicola TaxID=2950420 RepID=A0ABX0QEE6_9BACT|nr:LytTR family DNA-binding domain-containing protein [Fibrivirga algicola]ARK11141.1 hypothetical protein A6C57_12860 [Fibrella sp. ES10-3-2-2]NID09585.1 response regulator transcription factor [Fibrivirga algicola]
MHAFRCLIIEDSEPASRLLIEYLTELSLFSQLTPCLTLSDAITTLLRERYDLIFLDVELNSQNGLDLLSAIDDLPPVIVMSAHDKYAIPCFDLNVADYLQKPFGKLRLIRSIDRAIGISATKENVVTNEAIFLKIGRRLQKFDFTQVDYIEAYGIYSKIHFQGRCDVVNEPIMTLGNRLPKHLFRRVHKSYIVNLSHITSYNQNNFFIGEAKIPLGTSYREQLPNLYNLVG